jgi:hypothetical protein
MKFYQKLDWRKHPKLNEEDRRDVVRVHLEFGDLKVDFEGDAHQVVESMLRFVVQVCPGLEILRRITYEPDLMGLISRLSGLVELSSEGPIINLNLGLSAKNAICLALLGAYIGKRIGKLEKDTLSISELSRLTSKSRKTVGNEIPALIRDGLIEKTSGGEYRITELGMKRTEEVIETMKEELIRMQK